MKAAVLGKKPFSTILGGQSKLWPHFTIYSSKSKPLAGDFHCFEPLEFNRRSNNIDFIARKFQIEEQKCYASQQMFIDLVHIGMDRWYTHKVKSSIRWKHTLKMFQRHFIFRLLNMKHSSILPHSARHEYVFRWFWYSEIGAKIGACCFTITFACKQEYMNQYCNFSRMKCRHETVCECASVREKRERRFHFGVLYELHEQHFAQ